MQKGVDKAPFLYKIINYSVDTVTAQVASEIRQFKAECAFSKRPFSNAEVEDFRGELSRYNKIRDEIWI